jgi:hypothetical protein
MGGSHSELETAHIFSMLQDGLNWHNNQTSNLCNSTAFGTSGFGLMTKDHEVQQYYQLLLQVNANAQARVPLLHHHNELSFEPMPQRMPNTTVAPDFSMKEITHFKSAIDILTEF